MKLRIKRMFFGFFILAALIYVLNANYPGMFDGVTGSAIKGSYTNVDLYVMSQCPYGVMAENEFIAVNELLGDYIDLNIEYIGREQNGEFQSLHGQPEVNGNIVQLCAKKYYFDKYFEFISCQNEKYNDLVGSIDECAELVGINADVIKNCYNSDQGKALLSESFKKAQDLQVMGSPTIYIGGTQYSGKRDSTSLKKALCRWLEVKECDDIPECDANVDCNMEEGMVGSCENPGTRDAKCVYTEPEEIELIVINDKECTSCDASQIVDVLKSLFIGTKVRELDVSEEEAKNFITSMGVKYVPTFIYDKKIAETLSFKSNTQLQTAFEDKGDYFKIYDQATGASYLIDENEKNRLKVALSLGEKPQIDFFVMSYCPYGNTAEESISEVYDLFGDKVKLVPHYVIYSNYAGGGSNYCLDEENRYCSMHGIQELNQNIRELCVYEQKGIGEYFNFVKNMNSQCSASNADTCWTNVAKELGYDTNAISSCEKEKGVEYSDKDLQLNHLLGVTGSPTIYINGVKYNGVRSAAGYQQVICDSFEDKPEECSTFIASTTTTTATGGCGN